MKLRVEYRFDPESNNWSFTVPSLGIVGGADTREQAAAEALAAIEFTLECENDAEPADDGEVEYVPVSIGTR